MPRTEDRPPERSEAAKRSRALAGEGGDADQGPNGTYLTAVRY